MRGFIAAGAALIAVIAVTTVQAENSGNSCAKENDAAKRLLCYDGIFRNEIKAETTVEGTGKWRIKSDTSKIEDTTDYYVSLLSDDTIAKRFGGSGQAGIYLRCKENTTSVYFIFADEFVSDIEGYGDMTYRLDSNKPLTKSFEVSTDNKALGLWDGGSAIPFLKAMSGKDQLIVRMTPYNQSPLTMTFDIRGFDEAIKPLRAGCKW